MADGDLTLSPEELEEARARRRARTSEERDFDYGRNSVFETDSPDEAAFDLRTSEEKGVPRGVVAADRDGYRAQEEAETFRKQTEDAPRLGDWLRRADNYAVARDDTESLGLIEQVARGVPKMFSQIGSSFYHSSRSADERFDLFVADAEQEGSQRLIDIDERLYAPLVAFYEKDDAQGARNALKAIMPYNEAIHWTPELYEAQIDRDLEKAEQYFAAKSAGDYTGNELRNVNAGFGITRNLARLGLIETQFNRDMQPAEGFVEQGFVDAGDSLGRVLPGMVAGFITRSPSVAAGFMGAESFGREYADARSKGLGAAEAREYAAIQSVIEIGTERFALAPLFKGGGNSLLKRFVQYQLREQVGEQVATLGQDFTSWQYLNPEGTLDEYIAARPEAAARTAIATFIMSTTAGAPSLIIEDASRRAYERTRRAMMTETEQSIDTLMNGAQEAKLHKRNAGKFKEAVETMVEGTGVERVVLDLNGLEQALEGTDLDVETTLEQLNVSEEALLAAVDTGGEVEIASADLLASDVLSKHRDKIQPHVRTVAEGDLTPSQRQTEVAERLTGELGRIQEITEETLRDVVATEETRQSVRDMIASDLEGAGVYTDRQIEPVADATAALIETTARKFGMEPKAFMERYAPVIRGVVAGQVMQARDRGVDFENVLGQAAATGYEGSDRGEATEWVSAVEKGLDMSQEARMGRKDDWQAERETPDSIAGKMYHATRFDFEGFDPNKGAGTEAGFGIHLGTSEQAASIVKAGGIELRNTGLNVSENSRTIPVYIRGKNFLRLEDDQSWEPRQLLAQLAQRDDPINIPEEYFADRFNPQVSEIREALQDLGVEGIVYKNRFEDAASEADSYIIFDPSNIRSVNAAFDPDHSDSANLLAQSAPATMREALRMEPADRAEWFDEEVTQRLDADGTIILTAKSRDDRETDDIVMRIDDGGGVTMRFEGRLERRDNKIQDPETGKMVKRPTTREEVQQSVLAFSRSIAMLEEYVSREKPESIHFTGSDSTDTRNKMYLSLLKRMRLPGYRAFEVGMNRISTAEVEGEKTVRTSLHNRAFYVIREDAVERTRARFQDGELRTRENAPPAGVEGPTYRDNFLDTADEVGRIEPGRVGQSDGRGTGDGVRGATFTEIEPAQRELFQSAQQETLPSEAGVEIPDSNGLVAIRADALGFTTSAEKALFDPPPRFRDARNLTADQWRKYFREAGATKEAFDFMIEPALAGLPQKGDIRKADVIKAVRAQRPEVLSNQRIGKIGRDTADDLDERGLPPETDYRNYVSPGDYSNYRQELIVLPDAAAGFKSHNWNTEGVVGHIRTTDRKTTSGESVRFVDELQSDLHQEGAKYGYRGAMVANASDKARADMEKKFAKVDALAEKINTYRAVPRPSAERPNVYWAAYRDAAVESFSQGRVSKEEWREAVREWVEAAKKHGSAQADLGANPPRAPMQDWEKPFIRRVIQQAIEDGKEVVAFTNHKTLHMALQNEGTQKFYDDRLPAHIRKVAKELGAKVERIEIDMRGRYQEPNAFGEIETGPIGGVARVLAIRITPKAKAKLAKGNVLFQQLNTGNRGSFNPDTNVLTLFEGADMSTTMHEMSHWYLDLSQKIAESEDAPAALTKELAAIEEWYAGLVAEGKRPELEGQERWRDMHETFAESFEAYLREGKAPSSQLKKAFQAFKDFLTRFYRSLTQLERANLTPEIRDIFDRMLASDDQITAATAKYEFDAKAFAQQMLDEGIITERQFKNVGDRLHRAREKAKEELLTVLMDDHMKGDQAWYRKELARITDEVAREFDRSPEGRALNMLGYGVWMGDDPGAGQDVRDEDVLYQGMFSGARQERYQAEAEQRRKEKERESRRVETDQKAKAYEDRLKRAGWLNQSGPVPSGWGPVTPPPEIGPVRLDLKATREMYGEEAVRRLPSSVKNRSASAEDIKDLVEDARQTAKTLKKKPPQSLLQFLRSRKVGGITDPNGELKGRDASGLINNKSGMDIDYAREAAEEAGFISGMDEFSRSTEQDLLDAIDREMAGDPVYRADDIAAAEEIKSAEARAGWYNDNNVDIYETNTNKLRAMLKDMISENDQGALDPDTLADMFGFRNGEHLLEALSNTRSRGSMIKRTAEQRMKEEFGDPMNDGSLMERAREMAENDIRTRQAEIEMDALRKALGVQAEKNYAKMRARDALSLMSVKEIEGYRKFMRNAERHMENALEAAKKGDTRTAMIEKQRQVVNLALFREASRLAEKHEKDRKRLQGFYTVKGRREGISADWLAKIEAVLDQFELRASKQGQKHARDIEATRKYVDEMDKAGREDEVAPETRLLAELGEKKRFATLTPDEVQYLVDTIDHMHHMGKLKNKLLNAKEKRAFDAVISELVGTLEEIGKPKGAAREYSNRKTAGEYATSALRSAHAALMRPEHQFKMLDRQDNGPVWRALFLPFSDAADKESKMSRESAKRVREIYDMYSVTERYRMFNTSIDIPELGAPVGKRWTKMDVISIALNQGVQYNRDALNEGYGWGQDQVDAALGRLMTNKDWDFVEAVWEEMGRYKDESFALEERITGVRPVEVEGMTFTLPSGRVIEGKYYHLKYDTEQMKEGSRRQSKDVEKEALSERAKMVTKPRTRNGALIERKGSGGRPVRLSIDVFQQSVMETIHDIAYREAVIDADKIIRDPRFQAAYEDASGKENYRELDQWVRDIVRPPHEKLTGMFAAMAMVRRNMPLSFMGMKVGTALIQATGLLTAVPEIGLRYAASGTAKAFAGGPMSVYSAWKKVSEKSEFMRDRPMGYDRDIREITTSMGANNPLAAYRRNAFMLISAMDITVSTPIWIGAYDRAMAGKVKGVEEGNEDDSIAYADSIVRRTQTAGRPQDLARVMRSGEFMKMFTMIMGYFNNLYAYTTQKFRNTRDGSVTVANLLGAIVIVHMTVPILAELLAGRLIPDEDDEYADEDETIASNAGKAVVSNFAGMFPILRDMVQVGLEPKFGYKLSPVASGAEDVAVTFNEIFQSATGQDEWTEADVKRAVRALGAATGIPSSQLNITGDYVYDVLMGEEDPAEEPERILTEGLMRNTN